MRQKLLQGEEEKRMAIQEIRSQQDLIKDMEATIKRLQDQIKSTEDESEEKR